MNLNNYTLCRAVGSGMERNSVLTHLHEQEAVLNLAIPMRVGALC